MRKRINLLKLILGSMVPNTALISYRVKLFTESKQYTELQSKPLEKDQITGCGHTEGGNIRMQLKNMMNNDYCDCYT